MVSLIKYGIFDLLMGGGDALGNIVWFLFFMVFMLFYPRLMLMQTILKLEQSARMIEGLSSRGKRIVIKRIAKKPGSKLRKSISDFLEFFNIAPVSLDPFGIVKKFEHIVDLTEKRFKYFVRQVAPHMDKESQMSIVMGLSGAVSLNQIAKIVRHFVETIRKTKNLQLAMVLQMQLPEIERVAKALLGGTEALSNGWLIGDSAGSLVAAHMIGNSKGKGIEETIVVRKKIHGKDVFIVKAEGPGGRLGKLGKVVESIIKGNKIAKIITIDAKVKLEGEKTGSIAEGIGVAIGGVGVDRAYIENIAVKRNIPLDAVAIKMSQEEAIQPIKLEVISAVPEVISRVEDNIENTKTRGLKGSIIVVGVGNSNGVGNNAAAAKTAEESAKKVARIMKERKEKEKKKKYEWLWG